MFPDVFNPAGMEFVNPAFGRLAANNPEEAIKAFASRGIEPPRTDTSAFGMGMPFFENPFAGQEGRAPDTWGQNAQPVPFTQPIQPQAQQAQPAQAAQPEGGAPSLAGALSGEVPMPRPRPAEAGPRAASQEMSGLPKDNAAKTPAQKAQDTLKGLSGVKAPPPPTLQNISSPHIPAASAMPSGSPLAALLANMLGGATGATPASSILRLRQAVGGGH